MDKIKTVIKSIIRTKHIDLTSIDAKIKRMQDVNILHNTMQQKKAM